MAYLAAWMRQSPGLTLSAARAEGLKSGFTVGRREYEEARREATGSPLHPPEGGEGDAPSGPPPEVISEAAFAAEPEPPSFEAPPPEPAPSRRNLAPPPPAAPQPPRRPAPPPLRATPTAKPPSAPPRAARETAAAAETGDAFDSARRILSERERLLRALRAIDDVVRGALEAD